MRKTLLTISVALALVATTPAQAASCSDAGCVELLPASRDLKRVTIGLPFDPELDEVRVFAGTRKLRALGWGQVAVFGAGGSAVGILAGDPALVFYRSKLPVAILFAPRETPSTTVETPLLTQVRGVVERWAR